MERGKASKRKQRRGELTITKKEKGGGSDTSCGNRNDIQHRASHARTHARKHDQNETISGLGGLLAQLIPRPPPPLAS